MKRLTSVKDFKAFKNRILAERSLRETKPCLVICAGTGGQASGSNDILRIIKRQIIERDLGEKIALRITGCQGFCQMDPFIIVEPENNLYPKIKMQDIPRIIDAALAGEAVEELLYQDAENNIPCRNREDIPFFSKQMRLILGKNQAVDPIRIIDYLEQDGYEAFEKIISNPAPDWIISEIKNSGLRGRGGAGFPTGKKWEIARNSGREGVQKYIVCNADEGDPGAYMDRSLLEGNPHSIIEGMFAGGVAIGADRGIVYVRSEYPLAIKHLMIAIRQAHKLGLLGKDILGTGICFDVEIVRGAGAFVCGEETALIKSIEGLAGEPRQRPPFPIQKGIYGKPTCINNVETLANIPLIISRGGKEYSKIGVENNTGTKIFSLVGKIRNTGLVEVPLGTKIKEVVYDIGGGSVGKARIKAIQTGGPSGGCIPSEMFDLQIDYDSLKKAGSIMGSGGMIVMDETTCMVDIARYFMNFLKDESCGKCFTCRKGTQRMYEILDDITKGRGTLEQLDLLEELAYVVKDTTMCGLGQTAANPVLSTLRYFKHEYIEHIEKKHCRAGVCKELVGAPCQDACPVGTEVWRYVAHIHRGEFDEAYKVIRTANPLPSVCARVCSHPCEDRCRLGTTGDDSVAIRALKRFITDNVDPKVFETELVKAENNSPRVAVVGAGPAGLTAAHCLSLSGYNVTIFEAEKNLGGMLVGAIPPYRLPREVLEREINSLINENITIRTEQQLGKDFTVHSLLHSGFKAVFLAIGAHRSRRLGVEGEEGNSIHTGVTFLKTCNLDGEKPARGTVGVIGGGNSAIDAARTAIRFENVSSVTIYYRRTVSEMPAHKEEIEAARREGIKIVPLVSPIRIIARQGKLEGVEFIKNELGDYDNDGRRQPVPVKNTEHTVELDTLIIAIGEQPDTTCAEGIGSSKWGSLQVDKDTLCTNMKGVFAGGDAVTGPSTVINAIAAGKKAAAVINRYLCGEPLKAPSEIHLPDFYVERIGDQEAESAQVKRIAPPQSPFEKYKKPFNEVELAISEKEAVREAGRCLRCDLEFTQVEVECLAHGESE